MCGGGGGYAQSTRTVNQSDNRYESPKKAIIGSFKINGYFKAEDMGQRRPFSSTAASWLCLVSATVER